MRKITRNEAIRKIWGISGKKGWSKADLYGTISQRKEAIFGGGELAEAGVHLSRMNGLELHNVLKVLFGVYAYVEDDRGVMRLRHMCAKSEINEEQMMLIVKHRFRRNSLYTLRPIERKALQGILRNYGGY